jgi:hypothetical protein
MMSLSGWLGQRLLCVPRRPARSAPETHESRRLTLRPACTLHRTKPATAPPPRHARRPDEISSASKQSDFTQEDENQSQQRQFHHGEHGARSEEEKVAHPLGTSALRADPFPSYPRSAPPHVPGTFAPAPKDPRHERHFQHGEHRERREEENLAHLLPPAAPHASIYKAGVPLAARAQRGAAAFRVCLA